MKITIVTQRLDNPYLVAYDRILRKYGHGCIPSQPVDVGEYWKVSVNAYVPKRIIDEKTNREKHLTFYYKDIGELIIEKNTNKIIELPTVKEFKNNLINKRNIVRRNVEHDLIKVIGNPELRIKYGKMKFAILGMQPIYRTIISLLNNETPTKLYLSQIGYSDLVQLIVDLNYAEYINDQLIPTNKLFELSKKFKYSDVETAETFLGIMLANYYDYLTTTFRIINFVPYIRAATSYYGNSIEYGELIRMTLNSLRINIKRYYTKRIIIGAKQRFGLNTLVTEMVEAGILKFEDEFIKGRDEIFINLKDIRNTLPMEESLYDYM